MNGFGLWVLLWASWSIGLPGLRPASQKPRAWGRKPYKVCPMRWALFAALVWTAVIALFAIAVRTSGPRPYLSPAVSTSGLARDLSVVSTAGRMNPPWVV